MPEKAENFCIRRTVEYYMNLQYDEMDQHSIEKNSFSEERGLYWLAKKQANPISKIAIYAFHCTRNCTQKANQIDKS